MPLYVNRCLTHTSFLGFFAAFSSNVFPSLLEIVYIFFSYSTTNYIGHQAVVPSFWFRLFRPGFLITGMLYDVGMLGYCIHTEDITAVLLSIRIASSLYQVFDMRWLIKNWIPFFVQKEKRRLIFLKVFVLSSVWFLLLGSVSWNGSWQDRNTIFASVVYMSGFILYFGCGAWYLIRGGVDCLIQYRLHFVRNAFGLLAFFGMILGIVGLSIGDGGGNNLVETLDYHSAYMMIYSGMLFPVVISQHYFVVVFEELSWKYPNPMPNPTSSSSSPPSKDFPNESMASAAIDGLISTNDTLVYDVDIHHSLNVVTTTTTATTTTTPGNNILNDTIVAVLPENHSIKTEESRHFLSVSVKVACDMDVSPSSSIELTTTKNMSKKDDIIDVIIKSCSERERIVVVEDEKDDVNLEAAFGLVSQSGNISFGDIPTVLSRSDTTPMTIRENSRLVPYQSNRRFALAFDGINRPGSALRSNILTQQIMRVKLKRHEIICIEMDKLFCAVYQILIWEVVVWLAQIFLGLYLQSVNTPIPSGQNSYYCQTPLENVVNSAQYTHDFVFARR